VPKSNRGASDTTLREMFRRWFEILPACNAGLRDEAFRVRHSVYCEDLGFEPARADGLEQDEFDAQSIHLLIRHIPSASHVGCVRLVGLPPGKELQRLPFERVCHGLAPGAVPDAPERRARVAEVSRLAVVRTFRRRRGEAAQPAPVSDHDFSGGPTLRFPHVLVGLYLGVVAAATLHDIQRLFVLTEPRLSEHLHRLGLRVIRIGPPVEHRGVRVPSMIDVAPVAQGLHSMVRPLYEHILDSLRSGYLAAEAFPCRPSNLEHE
jgi:N-acyl amino acid synthase of PEP-CTERM/exosortase system